MARTIRYAGFIVASILALHQDDLRAQEIYLRAGTLLKCTLDEPNFSSHSAKIGDPLTCHARPVREFGRLVIPHGAYFVGRFEGYRNPGHFVGKGWIRLEFDRLVLPGTDFPISGRVISVGDFRVDVEGRIQGHGHVTRDIVGWAIPLLWPVNLVTIPKRGPRPTLKGEMVAILRLLEDTPIPREAYLTGANPNRKKEEIAANPTPRQSWNVPEEGQRVDTASADDVIKPVPPRVQDRDQMPDRFEDRYPRTIEVWRGWVPKREAETWWMGRR
jgi:hypothetical protein